MSASPAAYIVLCTCPDRDSAERLARDAVTQKLAACVNIVAGLTSIYSWKGAIEKADEVLLLAKTTPGAWQALELAWRSQHPYELPEIIAVPVATGSEAYLRWISEAVAP